jgi:CBS domain-containing protein
MKISDLMTETPQFCTPDDSIVDVAKMMAQHDVGMIPVCESRDTRKVNGVITDRDIVIRVIAEEKNPGDVSPNDIMTRDTIGCSPDDEIEKVQKLMEEHQVRRILAVDQDGSLVGVVALADLARAINEMDVGETVEAISQPDATPPK